MKVITFYSYKGGVGRTLAAANFAVYLAKLGLKTVVIDFDLEAPGIDAKFGLPTLSENQKGLLDYILEFQRTNQEMENIREIILPVPLTSTETNNLWLIPAGQYLSESYYRNLSQLDWGVIFSDKRDGVSFFQQFLVRIQEELQADFAIVDSRTGITEIAGLCTQQLADEVVMLSSLSSESIRVTKHIKDLIKNSNIAKAIGKAIDVKIVVSRVPKDEDLLEFKKECCKIFDSEEEKLFFLFSCPDLERKEFLALNDIEANGELVSNYAKLFNSLNLELANDSILAEIENVTRRLLLITPEEAEKSILQLVATYPHPEVYRAAMRFYKLKGKEKDIRAFAWKLIDISPSDEEGKKILATSYLQASMSFLTSKETKANSPFMEEAIKAIDPLYQEGKLPSTDISLYSAILFRAQKYERALKVALELAKNIDIHTATRYYSYLEASKCAFELKDIDLCNELKKKAESLNYKEPNLDDIPF